MNSNPTRMGSLRLLGWALGMLVLALPATLQAQFQYTTEGGTVTITGYTGPGGDVTIPSSIQGLPVATIGDFAFSGASTLLSVTIPDSVTSIGYLAFGDCSALTTVTIGNSVTSIVESAFANCSSLRSVTIPNSVTSIGWSAFANCSSLRSVEIGEGITIIDDHTFVNCSSLTSVIIGSSVTNIVGWCKLGYLCNGAFADCISLASIVIPKSVTAIGDDAFSGCTSLTSVYFEGQPLALEPEALGTQNATIHYLPGTTGWGSTYAGRPTALWIPITPNLPSATSDNPLKLVTHSPAPATVRVQRSANLVDWEDWQTVSRDAGPSELQDDELGTTAYRFYRGIEE